MFKRKGFSLIELLVVIAIIAVLAAILFPMLTAARERAKSTKCQSNMKQIALAIKAYGTDWDNKFPWCSDFVFGPPLMPDVLWKYASTKKKMGVWVCPADIGDGTWGGSNTPYWTTIDTSYGYPGSNYQGWGHAYLAGLSQDNPVDPAAVGTHTWIWRLPLSKRPLIFDHNPFHFLKQKGTSADRFSAKGVNNMICCDGHIKPLDYQRFTNILFGDTPQYGNP